MKELSNKGTRIAIVTVLVGFILMAGGTWYVLRGMEQKPNEPADLADFGKVPDQKFTERSGRAMSLGDLQGEIWVANFIFTRCGGSCLTMSSKMSDLQKSLRKAENVRLVSFTVDPEYDTPERLQDYAEGYMADEDKWLFLQGGYDQMQNLAKEVFRLTLEEGTDPVEPIIHSTRFILVDAQGHIRGYYRSDDPESTQKLLLDVGALMREMNA